MAVNVSACSLFFGIVTAQIYLLVLTLSFQPYSPQKAETW